MTIDYAKLLSRPEYSFDWWEIDEAVQGKRIVVTGAGGSIGSAIVRKLCEFEPEFIGVLGHSELPIFKLMQGLNDDRRVRFGVVDVGSPRVFRIFSDWKPDTVIHAAAHKHVGLMEAQPEAAFKNNTEGTISLAQVSRVAGVKRFVFISTDKAARPESNMGASKRLAEAWLLANWPEATVCRFGNVLGSSGSLVEIAAKKIELGDDVLLTDQRMTRYFITPTEAVGLVLTSGFLNGSGLYMLDMGAPVLILDVLKRLAEQFGLPLQLKITQAGAGEKLSEDLIGCGEFAGATAHSKIVRVFSALTTGEVNHALGRVREDIAELKAAAYAL